MFVYQRAMLDGFHLDRNPFFPPYFISMDMCNILAHSWQASLIAVWGSALRSNRSHTCPHHLQIATRPVNPTSNGRVKHSHKPRPVHPPGRRQSSVDMVQHVRLSSRIPTAHSGASVPSPRRLYSESASLPMKRRTVAA